MSEGETSRGRLSVYVHGSGLIPTVTARAIAPFVDRVEVWPHNAERSMHASLVLIPITAGDLRSGPPMREVWKDLFELATASEVRAARFAVVGMGRPDSLARAVAHARGAAPPSRDDLATRYMALLFHEIKNDSCLELSRPGGRSRAAREVELWAQLWRSAAAADREGARFFEKARRLVQAMENDMETNTTESIAYRVAIFWSQLGRVVTAPKAVYGRVGAEDA